MDEVMDEVLLGALGVRVTCHSCDGVTTRQESRQCLSCLEEFHLRCVLNAGGDVAGEGDLQTWCPPCWPSRADPVFELPGQQAPGAQQNAGTQNTAGKAVTCWRFVPRSGCVDDVADFSQLLGNSYPCQHTRCQFWICFMSAGIHLHVGQWIARTQGIQYKFRIRDAAKSQP
jgi:hypothetical protein